MAFTASWILLLTLFFTLGVEDWLLLGGADPGLCPLAWDWTFKRGCHGMREKEERLHPEMTGMFYEVKQAV